MELKTSRIRQLPVNVRVNDTVIGRPHSNCPFSLAARLDSPAAEFKYYWYSLYGQVFYIENLAISIHISKLVFYNTYNIKFWGFFRPFCYIKMSWTVPNNRRTNSKIHRELRTKRRVHHSIEVRSDFASRPQRKWAEEVERTLEALPPPLSMEPSKSKCESISCVRQGNLIASKSELVFFSSFKIIVLLSLIQKYLW